jgi:hypothetical protein
MIANVAPIFNIFVAGNASDCPLIASNKNIENRREIGEGDPRTTFCSFAISKQTVRGWHHSLVVDVAGRKKNPTVCSKFLRESSGMRIVISKSPSVREDNHGTVLERTMISIVRTYFCHNDRSCHNNIVKRGPK